MSQGLCSVPVYFMTFLIVLTICSTAVARPTNWLLQVGQEVSSGLVWHASQTRWPAPHCQILPAITCRHTGYCIIIPDIVLPAGTPGTPPPAAAGRAPRAPRAPPAAPSHSPAGWWCWPVESKNRTSLKFDAKYYINRHTLFSCDLHSFCCFCRSSFSFLSLKNLARVLNNSLLCFTPSSPSSCLDWAIKIIKLYRPASPVNLYSTDPGRLCIAGPQWALILV